MKNINEKSKEWCSAHSNKGCTEQCDGCWQLKQAWGCEQHNMETAYEAGANYVLEQIEDIFTNPRRYVNPDKSVEEGMVDALIKCVEQLKSNQ